MANWFTRLLGIETLQAEQRSTGYDRLRTLALSANGLDLSVGISEETALAVSAVYASVDRISSSLASVPFNLYERQSNGDRRLAREHDQFRLVHTAPSQMYTSFAFRKTLMSYALLYGNGYAMLKRDPVTQRPVEYQLLHPCKVLKIEEVDRELYYFVEGQKLPIPFYDMIHIAAMGSDGYTGKSPIRVHAETIGAAKSRNTYSASTMKNGGFLSGIIKYANALKPEQKEAIREGFQQKHAGSGNAGSTMILDYGMEYQPLTMSAADVQLIETMKFTVEDIARIYGIPPHMIGHLERSTNNNIEHQAIEYVQYCLMPWAIMMEQAFDSRVFRVSEKESGQYYTKLELNALMRGDVTARKEFYRMMLDRGVFSINEVRRFEDMNDTAGGDIRLVQANMIPLNLIENQYKETENGDS
jgi:HK97 family phage portal protein